MCPYELALKLHELGVNSESEFYFVKGMKGGGSLAYTENQFMKLIQDNGITYNDVIQRGWRL